MKKVLFILLLFPLFANAQAINTLAGNGAASYSGDGGPATSASLSRPISCVKDNAGNLLISDFNNCRIRKVSPSGIITTIAGTGSPGFGGDGGPATAAQISNTEKITVDGAGNIYFSDFNNQCVRKINTAGIITTIAGIPGTAGYSGDGGPAVAATFWYPAGIAIDDTGNIYITDEWNNRIRKINTSGIINTIAGNGPTGFLSGGYGGDGGPANMAQINFPVGIAVTASGDIIFSDDGNFRARKISPSGIINTVAGDGIAGSAGDGGLATVAQLNWPEGLDVDLAGNIYICEAGGNKVRKVDASTGIINTLAGTGTIGFSGDGGVATAAEMDEPEGVFVDTGSSCVYICDSYNNRVRVVGSCSNTIVSDSCNSLTMPDSLDICLGDTITLPAILIGSDSVINYTWSPATGLSSSTILNPLLTAAVSGWYHLTVNSIPSGNLVINGSFTDGNTGFSTGYTYITTGTSIPSQYGVTTDPLTLNYGWPSIGDHTTGAGNMLLVDGDTSAGVSFWCETLAVTPNTNYVFSLWSASLWLPLPTNQVIINGVVTGTFAPTATVGQWVEYQVMWNSGTAASANICMTDLNLVWTGNDFAIDDISFEPVCIATDSVYIRVGITDTAFTHSDTSVCVLAGDVTLYAPAGFTTPTWSNGATTSSVTVNDSGSYWVTAISACSMLTDTFHITAVPPKSGSLEYDTALCIGSAITLNATPGYTTHTWNNSDTASFIAINTAGLYWVINTNIIACSTLADTFNIMPIPLPVVALGNDTSLCPGDSILLSSPESSGTYVWSTGSTATSVTVAGGGTYVLTVTNFGCSISDTIQVGQLSIPTAVNLGPDTALCKGDQFMLSSGDVTALWSTRVYATNISVTDSGTYWASVTNQCGTATDSINVDFQLCDIFFPNAFSPNNDGLNDIARAIGYLNLYRDYSLSIYNRWGQRIFYTEDIYSGWDGKFNGVPQDIDTYFYMIFYTLEGKRHMMKGDLTLIR